MKLTLFKKTAGSDVEYIVLDNFQIDMFEKEPPSSFVLENVGEVYVALLTLIKLLVEQWVSKQGHDSCWYYPEIFREIANILGVKYVPQNLPARPEFEGGCKKYTDEVFSTDFHC